MSSNPDPTRTRRFLVDRMRSIESRVTESVHNSVVAEIGTKDLRVGHARLLAELGEGVRPSDLAARLGVTRGAIGQLVDRLEQRGYVTRDPDPTDRRAYLVRPTARARGGYLVSRKNLIAIEDQWRRVLGSRLMDELEKALEKLDDWRP
jgi:DNA-binding MarR family transcriptional regulator